jgi:hypothetical protein
MRPRLIGAVTAVLTTAAVGALAGTPASADSSDFTDCAYPYVCLYKVGDDSLWHKTGQFRDVTAEWQNLTVSRGAQTLVNTRHDDVVYVKHVDGSVGCFPAENDRGGEIAPIIAIRISWSGNCWS